MKLYFEIAIDQQTRARDRTFEVVPDSRCPPVPAGQPHPYLVNFAKSTKRSKNHALGALIISTSLLNAYKKLAYHFGKK